MKKFFKYILPLALIVLSVVVVMVMIAIAQGKRPERKETGGPALVVDAIPARVESLNFSANLTLIENDGYTPFRLPCCPFSEH